MPSNEEEGIVNDPSKFEYFNSEYSTARALYYMTDVIGIPKSKIHIGVPFYGRGWKINTSTKAVTTFRGKYEEGIDDTKELVPKLNG